MKLIIGNKNYSSWSLRAWLLLAHHELPFEEERIALDQKDTHARLAKYTDAARVPVLVDKALTVWDSLAICEYVSEHYLQGGGWPDEPAARAVARSCCAEMHSGFPEIRGQLPMNCRASGRRVPITPSLQKEIDRIDQMWTQCRARHASEGPWLFGAFSIADCLFAPVALRFNTYGVELSETSAQYQQQILSHEKVRHWVTQAEAESEFIEHEEVGR